MTEKQANLFVTLGLNAARVFGHRLVPGAQNPVTPGAPSRPIPDRLKTNFRKRTRVEAAGPENESTPVFRPADHVVGGVRG